jgi:DNA-binding IscR family transcriptional regulator
MRMSTAAELGVRGMAYLAKNYLNGPVPMATICREQ